MIGKKLNSQLKLCRSFWLFPLVSETEQSLWMAECSRVHSADGNWPWIRTVMWGVYCVGCFCRTWNSEPLVTRFLFVSDSWLMLFISHSWSHDQSWLMTRFTCLQSDRRSDCSFFFCGGWPAAVMFHQKMGSPLSIPRVVWGLWWWFPLLFPEAELPLTLWQHSPPALGFLLLLCDRRQDAVRSLHFLKKIRLAGRRVNVYLRNMCSPVDLRPSSTLSHSPDSDSLKCASLLAQ